MIPVGAPVLGAHELRYVTAALEAGEVSSEGRYVREFEEAFARWVHVPHATSASNGTTALHLALLALDLGPGDEVIVPAMTFVATANAARYVGATPVFVDVDPGTWTITAEAVEAAVTPRTRAVIPVHLFGHPADMDAITAVARRHQLRVVEDAAQAHGATYRGRCVGGLGDIATFSFYGNKIVTTGEGGMVLSADPDLIQRCYLYKNHGMTRGRRYWHGVVGYNYRMTNLQAAVGLGQLAHVDEILAAKRRIAARYREAFDGMPGLEQQRVAPWAECVHWMNCLVLDETVQVERDALRAELYDAGVDTRPLFVSLPSLPIYQGSPGSFPVSDRLGSRAFYVPSGATLNDDQVDQVTATVRDVLCRHVRRS